MPMFRAQKCMSMTCAVLGAMSVFSLVGHTQAGPAANEGKMAEQVYKNIQVLRGTPADQLGQSMHLLRAALGVECEFCHEETDRAADTKAPKLVARRMILMMNAINKSNFGAGQTVTCYTCHQGGREPRNAPDLPVIYSEEPSKVSLPPVDEVLSKYVNALGGEEALRKVTSRVITGTQFIPTGPGGTVPTPAQVERLQKAPNMVVTSYQTPTYTIAEGFDGSAGWSQDQRGRVVELQKQDQLRSKRDADFYLPLNLKQEYASMSVVGVEEVDHREAYVVIGSSQGDVADRLYFDRLTGLLVRKQSALITPLGQSPFQVNYEDYRDTGSGVKFPFLITMYPANPRTELAVTATMRVTKVQDNIPIENSKLARPQNSQNR